MWKKIFGCGMIIITLVILIWLVFYQSQIKQNSVETITPVSEIVRVGYREHTGYWPLFLGLNQNFFTKSNIKIEKILFSSTNDLMEALLAGRIDVALGGVNTILLATLENKSPGEFKIFTIANETKDQMFSSLAVRKDSPINSKEQLINKKISTQPGSTTKYLYRKVMGDQIGKDITNLIQMEGNLQLAALIAGQTEAAILFEPSIAVGKSNETIKIIESSLWANTVMNPFPLNASVLSSKFIKEKPELAKKFVQVTYSILDYAKINESKAKLAVSKFTSFSADLSQQISLLDNFKASEIDQMQLQKLFDLLLQDGEIKNPVYAEKMILSDKYVKDN